MGLSVAPVRDASIDATPVLVRSTGVFSEAELKRDELYEIAEQVLLQEGVRGLVLKSSQNVHPCWVKVETWLPHGGPLVTDRSSVTVTIDPKPFHRYELEYTVTLNDRERIKKFPAMNELHEADLRDLVRYQLRRGPKPSLKEKMLRRYPWELWKPLNKLDAFSTDWMGHAPTMLFALGFVTLGLGIGMFLFAAAAVVWIVAVKRPVLVRSGGKPKTEPRRLNPVDNWQAVIPKAGADYEEIRRRFLDVLNAPESGFHCSMERIWHWGLDGKVERDQIVVTLGRAIWFGHVYAYDNKLYVGWDSHLNWGAWVEKKLAQGLDRESGELVAIHTVEQGWQKLTEYDVTDVNCLSEWAHAQIIGVLKNYLKERRIDEEIDFKITRGERQGLLEQGGRSGWFKKKRESATEAA